MDVVSIEKVQVVRWGDCVSMSPFSGFGGTSRCRTVGSREGSV